MDGQANWIMGLVVAFGALFVAMLTVYSKSVFERFRARRVVLTCPADSSTVNCVVEEDLAHDHKLSVVTCSRLDPPCEVTCHQRCLQQMRS